MKLLLFENIQKKKFSCQRNNENENRGGVKAELKLS